MTKKQKEKLELELSRYDSSWKHLEHEQQPYLHDLASIVKSLIRTLIRQDALQQKAYEINKKLGNTCNRS